MKRVAVLRGGPSDEYDVSMKTGRSVLSALNELGYQTKDIVISRSGTWLDTGFERTPNQALEAIDIVFIALHGTYGEDGQLQKFLQMKKIPFTGSRAVPSGIAFNKAATKKIALKNSITTPKHFLLEGDGLWSINSRINEIYDSLGTRLFVKPVANGSSVGAQVIESQEIFEEVVDSMLKQYGQALVEEYIEGREATVGIIENFRDHHMYALPPIEIIPPRGSNFFDNTAKYSGQTSEICPGNFSYAEKQTMTEIAMQIHDLIGCEHYSRSDFLLKDGEVYFLEINTLPGLTSESLIPKAAAAVGLEFNELVRHLTETATA